MTQSPDSYGRVAEEIDVVPMKLIRRLIVRPKFKHKGDIETAHFLAPLPGLVAHLIVSK